MTELYYEPQEDTYMLKDIVKDYLTNHEVNSSLEIGVGNGILSKLISEHSKNHIGVDINPHALDETKKICDKGDYYLSDLFSKVHGTFDLIVFNPPYLPKNKDDGDNWITKATVGGKKGYEITLQFIQKLSDYLEGDCFLLFSSLSKPNIILKELDHHLLDYSCIGEKSYMMEKLFVYKITKNKLRQNLEQNGYRNICYFAKGSHGFIYTANKDAKTYAIKIKNKHSASENVSLKEAEKLQFVNQLGIGPKFVGYDKKNNYLIYEFVEGIPFKKYYRDAKKSDLKKIILDLLNQCHNMDKAGFEKKEMKRPLKNLLIQKNNTPVLIDFERGVFKKRCGNVTQFLQYLSSSEFSKYVFTTFTIDFDAQKINKLSAKYMKDYSTFDEIYTYIYKCF